jgi:ribosome-binding factor A
LDNLNAAHRQLQDEHTVSLERIRALESHNTFLEKSLIENQDMLRSKELEFAAHQSSCNLDNLNAAHRQLQDEHTVSLERIRALESHNTFLEKSLIENQDMLRSKESEFAAHQSSCNLDNLNAAHRQLQDEHTVSLERIRALESHNTFLEKSLIENQDMLRSKELEFAAHQSSCNLDNLNAAHRQLQDEHTVSLERIRALESHNTFLEKSLIENQDMLRSKESEVRKLEETIKMCNCRTPEPRKIV